LVKKLQSLSVFIVLFLLVAAALAAWAGAAFVDLPAPISASLNGLSIFAAIFLGIFIEAAPYLLLGTLASGLVEVFFNRDEIAALFPRKGFMGAIVGSSMGLFFPVCECGVVPLTRRLVSKGNAACNGHFILTGGSGSESNNDCQHLCSFWTRPSSVRPFGPGFDGRSDNWFDFFTSTRPTEHAAITASARSRSA
jgi:hypothetical protein